jgi:hypothetical protein
MTAKGTPDYYRARREQPAPAPVPRTTMVRCSSPSCALSFLSYHPKCPFCGTAAQETLK